MSSSDDPFFPNTYEIDEGNTLDVLSSISIVGMIFFITYAVPQMIFSIVFKAPSESDLLLQHNISHGVLLIISAIIIFCAKLKINISTKMKGEKKILGFVFCISLSLAITMNQQCNENSPLTLSQFISIGIFAPICEEIAFRGMFYSQLSKKCTPIISIFTTSILFALVHFKSDMLTKVIILFISALWNYVNFITESIIPSMIFHIFHNIFHSFSTPKIGLCGFPKFVTVLLWIFGTICGFIFINSNESDSDNGSDVEKESKYI